MDVMDMIDSVYQRGVMLGADYDSLKTLGTSHIRIIHDNQAITVPLDKVMSIHEAYQFIVHHKESGYSPSEISHLNIYNILSENLSYEPMKSEEELNVEYETMNSSLGFVMVNDEGRGLIEAVADCGVVEKLREKHGRGGVNDNERVGLVRELVSYSTPAVEVAHIFRDVDRTIECDLLVFECLFERQSGAQRITVRIFGLNDADMMLVFDEIGKTIIHCLILYQITKRGLGAATRRLQVALLLLRIITYYS